MLFLLYLIKIVICGGYIMNKSFIQSTTHDLKTTSNHSSQSEIEATDPIQTPHLQHAVNHPSSQTLTPMVVKQLQQTHGNQFVSRLVQRVRLSSPQPVLQRQATFKISGKDVSDKSEWENVAVDIRDVLQSYKTELPPDLLINGNRVSFGKIKIIIKTMMESPNDYGYFDLSVVKDVKSLIDVIKKVHLQINSPQPLPSNPSSPLPSPSVTTNPSPNVVSVQPIVIPAAAQIGKNTFEVVEKKKSDLLGTLAAWKRYFDYKIKQYNEIKKVDATYYKTFSSSDTFKNFDNVGTMIDTVKRVIDPKTQSEIHDVVRVAINPTAADHIAAILIYSSKPSGTGTRPAYIADLVANPKTFKPDRKDKAQYKQLKPKIADQSTVGKGRSDIPEASKQMGGGSSIIQHSVLESGPAGIKLAPFNEVTERIYKAMRFGAAKFENETGGYLVLKPQDMKAFADNAQGALKETVDEWRKRYETTKI
jgi:hypothetical protein